MGIDCIISNSDLANADNKIPRDNATKASYQINENDKPNRPGKHDVQYLYGIKDNNDCLNDGKQSIAAQIAKNNIMTADRCRH